MTRSPLAIRVRDAMNRESIAVPGHFDAEVLSIVERFLRRGEMDFALATRALWRLAQLPAERVALPPLLAQAFALRDRFSAYDALYVALAERLRAPLLTLDARLARAADGLLDVILITAG